MQSAQSKRLEKAIRARAERRGLTTNLTGLRYANNYLFDGILTPPANTLYVGVGHGLDALVAFAEDKIERATGVDPFIAIHGNDEDDYEILCDLVSDLGLGERFTLFKGVIQDYTPKQGEAHDLIVINDVLHHIFETKEPLRQSALYQDAVQLFKRLRMVATPNTKLVIGDVSRSGLRPLLGRLGLYHAWIDYRSKQNWPEWDAAIQEAGWRRSLLRNYVPFGLRKWGGFLAGPSARYSLCDKYYLYYKTANI